MISQHSTACVTDQNPTILSIGPNHIRPYQFGWHRDINSDKTAQPTQDDQAFIYFDKGQFKLYHFKKNRQKKTLKIKNKTAPKASETGRLRARVHTPTRICGTGSMEHFHRIHGVWYVNMYVFVREHRGAPSMITKPTAEQQWHSEEQRKRAVRSTQAKINKSVQLHLKVEHPLNHHAFLALDAAAHLGPGNDKPQFFLGNPSSLGRLETKHGQHQL